MKVFQDHINKVHQGTDGCSPAGFRNRPHQRRYQANPGAPLFAELRGIILETVGLAEPLRKALELLTGQIQAPTFVYGSVAKRQDTAASDNDLMVTSNSLSHG